MKLIKNFAYLFVIIFLLAGCATSKPTNIVPETDISVQPTEGSTDPSTASKNENENSSLMDLYISGEIPGYSE